MLRKPNRDWISLSTSPAIFSSSSVKTNLSKNSKASLTDNRQTSIIDSPGKATFLRLPINDGRNLLAILPPIVHAKISGRNRCPLQTSQGWLLMQPFTRFFVNSLSVSCSRRSKFGITPSKGFTVDLPFLRKLKLISSSFEPNRITSLNSSGKFCHGVSVDWL